MVGRLFRDRRDAGRILADLLAPYRERRDVIVLALPRGGVPVAYAVATAVSEAAPEAVAIRSELAQLRRQRGQPARLVVWAHNSHVGDERASERANIGDGEVPETFPHAVR
jgi:hypothetical protein